MRNDAAHDDWVAEARAVPLEEALQRLRPGHRLKRQAAELIGPCPVCGGTDRFGISLRKGVFLCRKCPPPHNGGDAIALARLVEGVDFPRACEILTGRPDPRGSAPETEAERAARARRRAEREARAAEARARREVEAANYRERERLLTRKLWDEAQPIAGTLAEAYLLHRGLRAPKGAHLRYAPTHGYFVQEGRGARQIWRGPAMLAAITDADEVWRGLHATWLDPRLGQGPGALPTSADGKAAIVDPRTGEVLAAKKTRGSAKGGRIQLVRIPNPVGLIRGEGIETALSVWGALGDDAAYAGWAVDSALSLGNMAGKAIDRATHPTERILRRDGTPGHRLQVPGPTPDLASAAAPVPDSVEVLIHLGDGDSEPFLTANALARAAARHHRPGRTIRTAMAPAGEDFNSIWRRRCERRDAAGAQTDGVAA